MAVFSTIGSVLASKSQNKAGARAAATSESNNKTNIDFATGIYNRNAGYLSPGVARGDAAGNQINALLGLGGGQQAPMAGQQPNALSQFQGGAGAAYGLGDTPGMAAQGNMQGGADFGAYVQANPDVAAEFQRVGSQFGGDPAAFGQFHYGKYGQGEGRALPGGQAPQTAQGAAENAFDIFRNSTGYQFRLGEGLDAVNSGYAGSGMLQSGAALRGITEYGQNFASNEFGNYMNALGAQQAVGAGSASSLAGVGQNFAGTVIGQNNFNTQNQMGAQLGKQNPFANALGTFGGAQQAAVGAFLGGGFG